MATSDFYFKRAINSLSLALPSTNSGKCCPCSTKLMPRPSLITKKILSGGSPVASPVTRIKPAERARFCSTERPYRMSQEIIDIGILLSWRERLLHSGTRWRINGLWINLPKETHQIDDRQFIDFQDCFDDLVAQCSVCKRLAEPIELLDCTLP